MSAQVDLEVGGEPITNTVSAALSIQNRVTRGLGGVWGGWAVFGQIGFLVALSTLCV